MRKCPPVGTRPGSRTEVLDREGRNGSAPRCSLPDLDDTFRWLTVGPPGQDDVSIVLMAVPGEPVIDEATRSRCSTSRRKVSRARSSSDRRHRHRVQGNDRSRSRTHRAAEPDALRHRLRFPRSVGQQRAADPADGLLAQACTPGAGGLAARSIRTARARPTPTIGAISRCSSWESNGPATKPTARGVSSTTSNRRTVWWRGRGSHVGNQARCGPRRGEQPGRQRARRPVALTERTGLDHHRRRGRAGGVRGPHHHVA